MYDYSDAYIVVRETIDLLAAAANENDNAEKDVVFKNNAPFRSCMSKISCTLIDTAKNLDIAMPMNILLEYSHNFPKISGRLWNYYRDEINNVNDTKIVGKTLEIPSQPGNDRDIDRTAQLRTNLKRRSHCSTQIS